MAKLTDADWDNLARDLSSRVAAFAPDWTQPSGSDPGMTVLELFAFLAESLLDRANASPEAAGRIRDIAAELDRIAASRCADAALTRPRYFDGKILTAEDLAQDQEYVRAKHRRHNRHLHGIGVVSGLSVSVGSSDGEAVVEVSPGVAVGPTGDELLVCERVLVPLGPDGSARFVTVALVERAIAPGPEGESAATEESARIALLADIPADHLVLARLERAEEAVRIDPAFEPLRIRR